MSKASRRTCARSAGWRTRRTRSTGTTTGRCFAQPPDLLQLIKLRELYGWLEETVDACKDASLILSEIVIKGS